jgi:hypothetical protein
MTAEAVGYITLAILWIIGSTLYLGGILVIARWLIMHWFKDSWKQHESIYPPRSHASPIPIIGIVIGMLLFVVTFFAVVMIDKFAGMVGLAIAYVAFLVLGFFAFLWVRKHED